MRERLKSSAKARADDAAWTRCLDALREVHLESGGEVSAASVEKQKGCTGEVESTAVRNSKRS